MEENTNVSQAIEELKSADDDQLKKVIERWFEQTRTEGMKIGASFISAAVYDALNKNLKDGMNSSHRDFKRAVKKVVDIVSVQLKQQETVQNDLEEETNDGTAE